MAELVAEAKTLLEAEKKNEQSLPFFPAVLICKQYANILRRDCMLDVHRREAGEHAEEKVSGSRAETGRRLLRHQR
ncbi:hypothetical protein C1H46_040628 [Malus baccata]|uniref:Uncharacterized protein n=1 Tax=Malus baccata TaxID=106549 RepID=A0A540KI01_MALBA|nr:hypothetical protein C1H46_040628 [Malus baccata]